jgi:aldehyde:ferredoxin oxidoreductase
MGSKNLKAIAVRGTRGIRIAKMEEFLKLAEEQENFFKNHPVRPYFVSTGDKHLPSSWLTYGIGTIGNWEPADWDTTPHPDPAREDEFYDKYSLTPHGCSGCPIYHFMQFDVPGIGRGGAKCTGRHSVSGYIWNDNFELAFRAYNLLNRYGLDVMSTTNIIAFLMELYSKGIISEKDTDGIAMRRGDEKAIISTIHKIGKQEGFGQLFNRGLLEGARRIGKGTEDYAMHVKGLELQPHEYRTNKQFALSAATSTKDMVESQSSIIYAWMESADVVGKNHFEEMAKERYGVKEAAFPTSYEKAAIVTVDHENLTMAGDMLGICKWVIPWFMGPYIETEAKLFSLATGVDMTEDSLLFAAQRVVTLERAFNVIKGMRKKDDTLPKRFFEEPVPGGLYKGERLSKAKFNKMLDEYYVLHGYDKDGIPEEATFSKYGLSSEWEAFRKRVPIGEKV